MPPRIPLDDCDNKALSEEAAVVEAEEGSILIKIIKNGRLSKILHAHSYCWKLDT